MATMELPTHVDGPDNSFSPVPPEDLRALRSGYIPNKNFYILDGGVMRLLAHKPGARGFPFISSPSASPSVAPARMLASGSSPSSTSSPPPYTAQDQQLAQLTQRIATLEREKTTSEVANAALVNDKATLEQEKVTLEEVKAILEQDNASLTHDMTALERSVANLERDQAELTRQAEVSRRALHDLTARHTADQQLAGARQAATQQEVARATLRAETAEGQRAEQERQNGELRREHEVNRARLAELIQAAARDAATLRQVTNQRDNFSAALDTAEAAHNRTKQRLAAEQQHGLAETERYTVDARRRDTAMVAAQRHLEEKDAAWRLDRELLRDARAQCAAALQQAQVIQLQLTVAQEELAHRRLTFPVIARIDVQEENIVLGHGANGEVTAVRVYGMQGACKRQFRFGVIAQDQEEGLRRSLRHEAEVLASIRCPHVVDFWGVVLDDVHGWPDLIIVERLVPVTRTNARTNAARIARDVARALRYLHARPIAHRDLKLSNVLYDPRCDIYKVGDLGEAKFGLHNGLVTYHQDTLRGTPNYMAPEIRLLLNGGQVACVIDWCVADIFSYAVTIIEVYCYVEHAPCPMDDHTRPELERRAVDLGAFPTNTPPLVETKLFLERCLTNVPAERPKATECLRFFDGMVQP